MKVFVRYNPNKIKLDNLQKSLEIHVPDVRLELVDLGKAREVTERYRVEGLPSVAMTVNVVTDYADYRESRFAAIGQVVDVLMLREVIETLADGSYVCRTPVGHETKITEHIVKEIFYRKFVAER